MDIKLIEDISDEELINNLNACLPQGIRVFAVTEPIMKAGKIAYARFNHIFELLGLSLFECYDMTGKPYKEVKKIATEINNFLNEENSDERKQI